MWSKCDHQKNNIPTILIPERQYQRHQTQIDIPQSLVHDIVDALLALGLMWTIDV
jgi:hypothetical protein